MLRFNPHRKLTDGLVALSLLAAATPVVAADYAPIDCPKASLPTESATVAMRLDRQKLAWQRCSAS
jgi:hypothetical protein